MPRTMSAAQPPPWTQTLAGNSLLPFPSLTSHDRPTSQVTSPSDWTVGLACWGPPIIDHVADGLAKFGFPALDL